MSASLPVEVRGARRLRFDDGAPVRAASAIAPFDGGWLVVPDDSAHAAWWRGAGVARVRVLPPVDGHDLFDEASGTKRRKPDLEAAVRLEVGGAGAVLLLGSGSLPARMRAVRLEEGTHRTTVADLGPLYERVAATLGIPVANLNLEGACAVGGALRWFQRGNPRAGIPTASVDVDLPGLLAAVDGSAPAAAVPVARRRVYDLAGVGGVPLAITDAVALPGGAVLASAVAEDTPNAVDDGPVLAAALVVLDGADVVAAGRLPEGPAGPEKVEGLAVRAVPGRRLEVLAVVDADDPTQASRALDLTVDLGGLGARVR